MKCKGKKKRRNPQHKGKDRIMNGIKGHSWEVDKDGLRKCSVCGYRPPTQREKGSYWRG